MKNKKQNEWFNKTFRRNKTLKVLLLQVDGRLHTHYIIPAGKNNNEISIDERRYMFHSDHVYDSGGFKTVLFKVEDANSVDIKSLNIRDHIPVYSADDFGTAIESEVIQQFLKSSKSDTPMMNILLFIIIGGIVILAILIYQNQSDLIKLINELRENAGLIGG